MAASSLQNSSSTTTPLKSIVWSILRGDEQWGTLPLKGHALPPSLIIPFPPPPHLLLSGHQSHELPAHQEQLGPKMGHTLESLHQVPNYLRGRWGEESGPILRGCPCPVCRSPPQPQQVTLP